MASVVNWVPECLRAAAFLIKRFFLLKRQGFSAGPVFIKSGNVPRLLLRLMVGSGKQGSLQLSPPSLLFFLFSGWVLLYGACSFNPAVEECKYRCAREKLRKNVRAMMKTFLSSSSPPFSFLGLLCFSSMALQQKRLWLVVLRKREFLQRSEMLNLRLTFSRGCHAHTRTRTACLCR